MKEVNGVWLFRGDEERMSEILPKGCPLPYFEHLYAPNGLKAIDFKGKWCWTPASEEDFRSVAAQLRGIDPSEVDTSKNNPCSGPGWCNGTCDGNGAGCYSSIFFPGGSPPIWVCHCA